MASQNVAVLILYTPDGRILLQHRTKDAPTFPDYWAFFGGGIEAGESPEQAVKRECLEELGYPLTDPRHFETRRFDYRGREHTMHVFVAPYDGGTLTLCEGQAMGWFRTADTAELMMNDHDRSVVQALADRLVGKR